MINFMSLPDLIEKLKMNGRWNWQ